MGQDQKIKGWLTTFVIIGSVAVVIPMLGAQASDQRAKAELAEAAVKFRAADVKPVDFTRIETPRLRDAAEFRSLSSLNIEHRLWARERASEHQCLAEAVYYEARSESRSGQLAVADVVKNRVTSKHYPNSICGVVYQGSERPYACQFSFTCDGSMDKKPNGAAWQRAKDMAQLSLTGGVTDLTKNATHYHTIEVKPNWSKTLEYKTTIGFHKFYRPSWRERNTGTTSISIAPPS